MRTFSTAPRYEELPDGSIYVRVGVQTNCAGIAGVRVRIEPHAMGNLLLTSHEGGVDHDDPYSDVPAAAVPSDLRDALFRGVQMAYIEHAVAGIRFELISAMVHPVDANPRRFTEAGIKAVMGWLQRHPESCKHQLPDDV